MDFLNNFLWWQLLIISTLVAFLITYSVVPVIVSVSRHLNLYERNKKRSSHNGNTPTFGGVAIFIGFVISAAIFYPESLNHQFRYILVALVALFFTGMKDDLLVIDSRKKFLIQIIVSLIIVLLGDIRITSFYGIANIHEIPYFVSVIFSVFVITLITNAFNLIDGIDGLSSGVAILVTTVFGTLFILSGEHDLAIESFLLTGSLVAFFRYNVFSKKNKLFLGDTGSLIIGFLVAIISINFLESDKIKDLTGILRSVPAITIGILIVPLFDTLRVFVLRLFGGDPPFQADRKHIHHRLLAMGFTHLQATLIILGANFLIIGVVILLKDLRGLLITGIVLFIATGLSYIPVNMVDRRRREIK